VGAFTQSVGGLQAVAERFGGEERQAVAKENGCYSRMRVGSKNSYQIRTDVIGCFENVIFSFFPD
jgi:hypothetical protein